MQFLLYIYFSLLLLRRDMVYVNMWRGNKTIPRPKKFYRAGTAPPVLKFQDPPPGVCCFTTWLPPYPTPRFSTHPIEMTGYVSISCQSKSASVKLFFLIESVKLLDNHYGLFFHIAWSASFSDTSNSTLHDQCPLVYRSRSVGVSIA